MTANHIFKVVTHKTRVYRQRKRNIEPKLKGKVWKVSLYKLRLSEKMKNQENKKNVQSTKNVTKQ